MESDEDILGTDWFFDNTAKKSPQTTVDEKGSEDHDSGNDMKESDDTDADAAGMLPSETIIGDSAAKGSDENDDAQQAKNDRPDREHSVVDAAKEPDAQKIVDEVASTSLSNKSNFNEVEDAGDKPGVNAANGSASEPAVGEAAAKGVDNNTDPEGDKNADKLNHIDLPKRPASEQVAAKSLAGKKDEAVVDNSAEQPESTTLATAPRSDSAGEAVPKILLNKEDSTSDLGESDQKFNSASSLPSPSKERAFGVSLTLTKLSQEQRDQLHKEIADWTDMFGGSVGSVQRSVESGDITLPAGGVVIKSSRMSAQRGEPVWFRISTKTSFHDDDPGMVTKVTKRGSIGSKAVMSVERRRSLRRVDRCLSESAEVLTFQEKIFAGFAPASIACYCSRIAQGLMVSASSKDRFARAFFVLQFAEAAGVYTQVAQFLEYRTIGDYRKHPLKPRNIFNMDELLWVNCPSQNPKCVDNNGQPIGYDLIFRKTKISLVRLSDSIVDAKAVAESKQLMDTMLAWKSVVQTGELLKINPKGVVQKRWFMIYHNELSWYGNRYDQNNRNDVDLRVMIRSEKPSKSPKASKYKDSVDLVFKKKTYQLVLKEGSVDSQLIFDKICSFWSREDRCIVKDEPICHIHIILKLPAPIKNVTEMGLVLEPSAPLKNDTDVPWHGYTQNFVQVKSLPLLHKGAEGFVQSPAETAGLRVFDAIVRVNDLETPSKVGDIARAIRNQSKVEIMVVRLPYQRNVKHPDWNRFRAREFALRQTAQAKAKWGIMAMAVDKKTRSAIKAKASFGAPDLDDKDEHDEDVDLSHITAPVVSGVLNPSQPAGPRPLSEIQRSRVMSVYGRPPPMAEDEDSGTEFPSIVESEDEADSESDDDMLPPAPSDPPPPPPE